MPKIDVKSFLDKRYEKLIYNVEEYKSLAKMTPCLATILIGSRKDSEVYVRRKEESIKKAGMNSETYKLEDGTPINEIAQLIINLNARFDMHGILLQLPLNREYYSKEDEDSLIALITPKKDVDGLTPFNQAKLFMGKDQKYFLTPCTPTGIVELLKNKITSYRDTGIAGLNAVVVGRSQLLGNSLAQMLMRENANVTMLHSKSLIHHYPKTLGSYLFANDVDIICLCAGSPDMLTAKDLDPEGHDVTIIDAAMNVGEDGKLRGDLKKEDYPLFDEDFGECYIDYTSVPGGIGPITTFTLAYNLYKAACLSHKIIPQDI